MMETMIDFFPAQRCVSVLLIVLAISISVSSAGERVTSGEYFVKQSWSQENRFDRPYFVNVPTKTTKHKLPVFLFLHGVTRDHYLIQ